MIKWYVAKWNQRGIEFYERLGAKIDPDWHEFQMSEKSFRDLAASVAVAAVAVRSAEDS